MTRSQSQPVSESVPLSAREAEEPAAVRPVRVRLSRAKGWRMPPNTVVVARPSKWGNPNDWRDWRENWPFPVGRMYPDSDSLIRDGWCKDRAAQAFAEDLADRTLVLPVAELRGKNLACWCKPGEPCHADVLLELANAPLQIATPVGLEREAPRDGQAWDELNPSPSRRA